MVGGGDSAMEEAIFLAKFATKVTLVHRRDEFRASPIMVDRARATRRSRSSHRRRRGGARRRGREGDRRAAAQHRDGRERDYPTDGLFVAIGHDPTTELFMD